jgi:hypothetical protein
MGQGTMSNDVRSIPNHNRTIRGGTLKYIIALLFVMATIGCAQTETFQTIEAEHAKIDTLAFRGVLLEMDTTISVDSTTVDSLKAGIQIALDAITTTVSRVNADSIRIGQIKVTADSVRIMARKDSIISYINVSPGTIKIAANKIQIDGTTVFGSGYSPTDIESNAEGTAWAYSSAAQAAAIAASLPAGTDLAANINLHTTTINGGKITTGQVVAGSVISTWVYANILTAAQVNAVAINATSITTGTLDAARLNVAQLNALNIKAGSIDAANILGGTITASITFGGSIMGDNATFNQVTVTEGVVAGSVSVNGTWVTGVGGAGGDIDVAGYRGAWHGDTIGLTYLPISSFGSLSGGSGTLVGSGATVKYRNLTIGTTTVQVLCFN